MEYSYAYLELKNPIFSISFLLLSNSIILDKQLHSNEIPHLKFHISKLYRVQVSNKYHSIICINHFHEFQSFYKYLNLLFDNLISINRSLSCLIMFILLFHMSIHNYYLSILISVVLLEPYHYGFFNIKHF